MDMHIYKTRHDKTTSGIDNLNILFVFFRKNNGRFVNMRNNTIVNYDTGNCVNVPGINNMPVLNNQTHCVTLLPADIKVPFLRQHRLLPELK